MERLEKQYREAINAYLAVTESFEIGTYAEMRAFHSLLWNREQLLEGQDPGPEADFWGDQEEQGEQCPHCGRILEDTDHVELAKVDLDPGNPEVGPRPDIQTMIVHRNCQKGD